MSRSFVAILRALCRGVLWRISFATAASAQLVELGANDFRVSNHSGVDHAAQEPDVAWDAFNGFYLAVWSGRDDWNPAVGEYEIYGRLIYPDGSTAGGPFRLSSAGPDGNQSYDALAPAVVSNGAGWVVAWFGSDSPGGQSIFESEIFVQRLDASGAELGVNDRRISDMGGIGDYVYSGHHPAVAYDPTRDVDLVAWQGGDFAHDLADGEFELFAQWVDGDGTPLLPNDARISDMGPTLDPDFGAAHAALGTSDESEQLLAVWVGEDLGSRFMPERPEIFGQLLADCGLFCDGFESGDIASWDSSAP